MYPIGTNAIATQKSHDSLKKKENYYKEEIYRYFFLVCYKDFHSI